MLGLYMPRAFGLLLHNPEQQPMDTSTWHIFTSNLHSDIFK